MTTLRGDLQLSCTVCGLEVDGAMTCPDCGPWGILEVTVPLRRPAAGRGMVRWRPLLPIAEDAAVPPLEVGDTPVVEAPRLAEALGVGRLRLKDDGRNPTGSLKDRASYVGAALAGQRTAACASTGNAASSLAGMCASLGQSPVIFVPQRAPAAKLAQLLVYGAQVYRVKGSYDQAYALCAEVISARGFYDRNAAVNPYMVEGKKTCGLELGELDDVDWVAVSVGDGCTLAGIWKGLVEMHALGLLPRLPKMLGVQAERSPAIYEEWRGGGDAGPARAPHQAGADTIADSISVAVPRNWRRAVRAIDESGGRMVLVSDAEIDAAMRQTARLGGVYGEPAAAASVAGLAKAGLAGQSVVAVITGHGLKDTDAGLRAGGPPIDVAPDLEAWLAASATS